MELQGCAGMTGETFRRLTGVRKRTFAEMVTVLEVAEAALKKQGGKPSRLTVETRLRMTLDTGGNTAPISTLGTAMESARVRPLATSAGARTRSSRAGYSRWRARMLSSGVTGLTRWSSSTRRKRPWNDLKKKRHTLKTQLVVDKATGTIICLAHAAGMISECSRSLASDSIPTPTP